VASRNATPAPRRKCGIGNLIGFISRKSPGFHPDLAADEALGVASKGTATMTKPQSPLDESAFNGTAITHTSPQVPQSRVSNPASVDRISTMALPLLGKSLAMIEFTPPVKSCSRAQ
jgi:hypothetical protein